jgi:hypothetical protein
MRNQASESIVNQVMESVMDLIDEMRLFSLVSRGALGTGNGICCEVGPSGPEMVFLDKNQYIVLDFTINAKHENLQTLSDAMNRIHEELTMLRQYPTGGSWDIVDITTLTKPQVIGREDNNAWLMASALNVKYYTKL